MVKDGEGSEKKGRRKGETVGGEMGCQSKAM